MKVRGAPAIGITAAYGMALAGLHAVDRRDLAQRLTRAGEILTRARPTAMNLEWAVERMASTFQSLGGQVGINAIQTALIKEAQTIHKESVEADMRLSEFGADLLRGRSHVLTHCDTGPLATAGYGTALGVIRKAHERDPNVSVLVDETRPLLQGSRLTGWELSVLGVPVTILTDGMAGYAMSRGDVDAVVVGADRVAANGDIANKIGTYSLAVLAAAHEIPFYVAAPTSSLDLVTTNGTLIPIEERDPREVTSFCGIPVAPLGVPAMNPAFDITPARRITAIVTEAGVARPPYGESLRQATKRAALRRGSVGAAAPTVHK